MAAIVTGVRETVANFRRLRTVGLGTRFFASRLTAEAFVVIEKAKRITPVDTGALRASGGVDAPIILGKQVTVNLGFGDAVATYAIPVHERTDVAHDPPTQAKFLEDTFKQELPKIISRMGVSVSAEIAGAVGAFRALPKGAPGAGTLFTAPSTGPGIGGQFGFRRSIG